MVRSKTCRRRTSFISAKKPPPRRCMSWPRSAVCDCRKRPAVRERRRIGTAGQADSGTRETNDVPPSIARRTFFRRAKLVPGLLRKSIGCRIRFEPVPRISIENELVFRIVRRTGLDRRRAFRIDVGQAQSVAPTATSRAVAAGRRATRQTSDSCRSQVRRRPARSRNSRRAAAVPCLIWSKAARRSGPFPGSRRSSRRSAPSCDARGCGGIAPDRRPKRNSSWSSSSNEISLASRRYLLITSNNSRSFGA